MTALKFTMISALLIVSLSLVGCNTARGLGQDLSKVGSKIEQAADDTGGTDNDDDD